VAVMILESAMDLDESDLDNVDITINDVYAGSVVIEYTLESDIPNLVASAMSNIDDMLGETITIGDSFVLQLDTNTVDVATDTAGIEGTGEGQAAGLATENDGGSVLGMGTTVEIALGAALCIVCIFLICVMVKMRKKPSLDHITELKMTDVNSRSVHSRSMHSMTQSRVSDASVISPSTAHIISPSNATVIGIDQNYQRIMEILKECDPEDWESYLEKFKKEKLTDDTLTMLLSDSGNDIDTFWKELLPPIGIRLAFKKKWSEEMQNTSTTPGAFVKVEGVGQLLNRNTSNLNIAEVAECEGNETAPNFAQQVNAISPVPPQADIDDMKMIDDEAALPDEPDDDISLQKESSEEPKPAFAANAMAGSQEPDYQRGVTYDYQQNDSGSENDLAMYEPAGAAKRSTLGNVNVYGE